MLIIKIMDVDGPHYGNMYLVPDGVDADTARALVDEAIIQVIDADPDEYDYDDLNMLLAEYDFVRLDDDTIIYSGEIF